MKAFSDRNPIVIGVVGLLAIAAVGTAVYYADDLPLIGGGTGYSADFTDAAALRTGDDVRVAGVKVGTVTDIDLARAGGKAVVRVGFKVKDAWIGNQSTVGIRIKTTLGREYLAIAPSGPTDQNPDSTIGVDRTSTPLDVQAALSGLSNNIGSIDTAQLGTAFDTLANAFAGNTTESVKTALTGLARLSTTIADRDVQLQQLAQRADTITGIVADRNADFATLINSGAQLLTELQARSAAITQLLDGTRDFARTVSGIVADNQATLGPALTELDKVADILVQNKGNIDAALKAVGPYYTVLNNAAGNGPWLDVYICGLFNGQTPILDAKADRNCHPGGAK